MERKQIFLFLTLRTLANFLFLAGITFFLYLVFPLISVQAQNVLGLTSKKVDQPQIKNSFADVADIKPGSRFGDLLKIAPPLSLTPVNTNAAIVIEKLGINNPIIWNVSALNEKEYMKALDLGVAHAAGTKLPDEKGNVFLFDHSTANPLQIARYSAVFTPLNQLLKDDRIIVFYQGHRYDYLVNQKEVVSKSNVEPLTKQVDEAILTLMTCDPPGVDLNRLIVTAKRAAIY